MNEFPSIETLRQIITRLERLSVDSTWSHQAAGLRGSLLAALTDIETGHEPPPDLPQWIDLSFTILVMAAHDIPGDDEKINLA